MKRVYSYQEARDLGMEEIGNKTANLLMLTNNGVLIPAGVVIPQRAISSEKWTIAGLEEELMTSELGTAEYFCVRSSSLNEDSGSSSYAGQYETYCGVRKQEIGESVKKVIDSLNSKRANNYRQQKDNKKDGMAVLIQELIKCEKSGVLFTKNPLNGSEKQFVLEAGYGLGDPIVSGEITPDNYIIDTNTGIVTAYKGLQEWGTFFSNGKLEKRETGNKAGFCLTDTEIAKIVGAGERIRSLFGSPQDIEWGFYEQNLFILQSRSITT